MDWLWGLGVRSNEQAVTNAHAATTRLSRQRVERDEIDLYLRSRYADAPPVGAHARSSTALDAPRAEAAR